MIIITATINDPVQQTKFIQIHELYSGILLSYAFDIVKNQEDAEDCVADSFEILSRVLDETPEKVGKAGDRRTANYMITIVRNRAKNFLRKKARFVTFEFDENSVQCETDIALPEYQQIELKETQATLLDIITNMKPKYRDPLLLYYYQECSIAEIANTLEINVNYASVLLLRGRNKLKQSFLEKEAVDERT